MKNLIWFCLGIVTGRSGLPILWHTLYIIVIAAMIAKHWWI